MEAKVEDLSRHCKRICAAVGNALNLGDLAGQVVDINGKKLKPASVKAVIANKAPPRPKHYTISPFRAISDHRINKTAAMIVLLAICSYTNRNGETWVSQQTIADLLQVSRQAVGKQVKRLIELGYIEVLIAGTNHFSNRYRVIFDPNMTREDVNAAIPAALQPEQPAPQPLSKEAARERLKQAKQAIQTQPQKLHLSKIQTQPLEVASKSIQTQPNKGSDATSEVAPPATSRGCMIEGFKDIEGIRRVWFEEGFEVASSHECVSAHERACDLIDTWQIPTELLGDLLHHTKTECCVRSIAMPTSADHFARLGEDGLWELIARMPARRAIA